MNRNFFYSILFMLAIASGRCLGQESGGSYDSVSNYIYIKSPEVASGIYARHVIAFVLTNIDSTGNKNWQSGQITSIEKDDSGYFVKVNLPPSVIGNSSGMWCKALMTGGNGSGYDTTSVEYGGVRLSRIKLILQSSPEGAESFLIPNRIWMSKIDQSDWQADNSMLEKFRVNTSSTNTYVYVDETVFVVLYKMDNRYKKVIHYTKPASIETEQTVWVKF